MDHALEAGDRLQAFHTNAPVGPPAAYEDFGRAVDTLLRLGRFDEAVLLWADCVEIQLMGERGVEACRRAGLPHVLTWHASAAGIVEEGTNFRSWRLLRGLQSFHRRRPPPQTLGLEPKEPAVST